MWIVLLWIVLAFVVAAGAANRGRDSTGWFLLAIVLSPLLAGLMLLIVGQAPKTRRRGYVECPHCAEMIRPQAIVCPHCRSDLAPPDILLEAPPAKAQRRSWW